MTANLRILNLEDSPNDLELMRRILQSEWPGCEVVPVSDRDEFASRLLQGGFDVVLSDNTLPGFDGVSALKLAREVAPDVPFIFVSGTIGEEFAIESLRNGATDYVLKHHMNALVPAVKRALREAEERARRHQAETTLRRREQYFRALTENLLDIVTILSADGRFRYNSPSAERVLGFTPGELADRIAFELIHPDDVAAARSTLADCVQHPGRVVQLEFRFRHKDGSYRYLESVGRSLLDHPEIAGVVVNSRDITDRKELEARFLRTQRLETIGVLASGVAHDLNNALVPVLMGVGLLRQTVHDDDSRHMLEMMENGAKRGAEMIKQILAFARGVQGVRVQIELDRLIKETAKIITDTFAKNIRVRAQLPAQLWPVSGDATQLHQVLMNLCVNARDAMPEGGQLVLSADNLNVDASLVEALPGAKPGPYVVVRVDDSGAGIPPENLVRIFQPFFTTKDPGQGTGLGLSTSQEIVQNHGGFIKVTSEVGKGTRFSIYLPATDGAAASAALAQKKALPAGRGELVLVADDEGSIRQITSSMLETYGYRVVVASDGAEAVAIFAQHINELSVALTDLSMPYMDGPAAIRAMLKIKPDIRIIAVSGLGSHREENEARDSGVKAFLRKPYSAEQLLTALHDVLAAP